ncbi:MAG TPA: hypothetical protein VFZ52_02415 [Chryseolinea sp.]
MIEPLRSYHFLTWQIFALLLPLAIFLAIAFRGARPAEYSRDTSANISFTLNKLSNHEGTLTVNVKNSLRAPSCVVYLWTPSQNLLLGDVSQIGSYPFRIPLNTGHVTVSLYDAIHKREIVKTEVSVSKE